MSATTNNTPAASPATIHELAEQAQRALYDAAARLELAAEHRTHEVSSLARQALKDLRGANDAVERIEQASAPQDAHGASTSTATPAPGAAATDDHGRGNYFDAGNVLDTLHRVNCGMALLGRVDDSEDFCEDSDMGKFFLLNTMRRALNAAADRIQADRQQEAAE